MADRHPFRLAAEAKDLDLLSETLSEDVVLHSPVLFHGFEGRELVTKVLTHVAATLDGLLYVDELGSATSVALRFQARVGELQLEGIDFLELNRNGRVRELTVFMRPMSALTRFNELMKARLEAELGGNPASI